MSAPNAKWVGLNAQISVTSGWGLLFLHFCLTAEKDGRLAPVPLFRSVQLDLMAEAHKQVLQPVFDREKIAVERLRYHPSERVQCEFPIIHALGNELGRAPESDRITGTRNVAITFFESTYFPPAAYERAQLFDVILCGSSWNTKILRKAGIHHVDTFLQALDLEVFRPVPRDQTPGRPFFIFSGGKLEFRKGQDIVVEAFRRFRQRHADAVLITAWQNQWRDTIVGIDSKGYVNGLPSSHPNGLLELDGWLEANGLPRGSVINLEIMPNHYFPLVYAKADVAVFPNRCEGGTNMVAMECMACGLPVILSANTGHLDLVDDSICYPLRRQAPVKPVAHYLNTSEWGESDPEEIVEALERVYADRGEAQRKGTAAATFMRDWNWPSRLEKVISHLNL